MMEKLGYFTVLFFFISGTVGLFNWSKLPNYKSKMFFYSILLSLITEILGFLFNSLTGLLSYYLYNIYTYVVFVIYFFILRSILKNYYSKILSLVFIIIYTFCFIINVLIQFEKFGHDVYSGVYSLGVLFFIILSSLYLMELFNSNNILNYKKNIFFWFIIGILTFHVPFMPFMLSLEWFMIDVTTAIYWIILVILNFIMNTFFVIGFIWTEKKYNY